MEVPIPRPSQSSMSQANDLLLLDSNDVSYLEQLDQKSPSFVEPTPEYVAPKPSLDYNPPSSARVDLATKTTPILKQEPIQESVANVVPDQNLYKIEPPKEKPHEFYRPEVRPPTIVEPPKERPVEIFRGYPTLEAPAVSSPSPVYTPVYQKQSYAMPPPQQQMPTIQLPSNQQVNQVLQTQQTIASINTTTTQHMLQSREMVVKFEGYFDRMITWMESIDRRLSKLEVTTVEIQKNQQAMKEKLNSTPSTPAPSMMPYFLPTPSPVSTTSVPTASAIDTIPISSYELETATKMQQTLDSDAELARKLQAEFEYETKTVTKKPEPKIVMEECPVCQKKISSKEFNDHVNECLDKASKDDKTAQSGFFSRFFKKNETPTPAPEKTEVPLNKKPTSTATTSSSQTSSSSSPSQITPPPMYPSFQPYVMPQGQGQVQAQGKNGTPFFFPQAYPFQQGQGQPLYYFPQPYPFPQQGQQQPKKQ